MSKKKICFIAQFPPPMHGLSKAVETLYNSELNTAVDSNGEFEFEKVDITNNKNFVKNLLKISCSKADLFYFTISQTRGGNLRDLVIFKLLELQHKKCLIHLHGGYYRQLVDNDMAGWQRKANYKANGMFIITTDHAGIPDIVKDGINGLIIQKKNCASDFFENLQNQDTIEEIVINNRKLVAKRFKQNNYINAMDRAFRNILNKN